MSNGSIKYKNQDRLKFRVRNEGFWDFKISNNSYFALGNNYFNGNAAYDGNLISYFDFSNASGFSICGDTGYTWKDAVNSGISISDYWMTGLDNGGIYYTEPFEDWKTGFTYTIEKGNKTLCLHKISGQTRDDAYEVSASQSGITFNGGFYQGFYNLYGEDYKILPNRMAGKTFEFIINPSGKSSDNILNKEYPDNSGIFFYMGLRSENKIWEYTADGLTGTTYPYRSEGSDFLFPKSGVTFSGETINDGTMYTTSSYLNLISSNNKYLFFNNTESGVTTDTFDSGADYEYYYNNKTDENKYLYYNNTCTGKTVGCCNDDDDSIVPLTSYTKEDITNNNIAFIITDDGKIGYRILKVNCDKEGYPLEQIEEYSSAGTIKIGSEQLIDIVLARDIDAGECDIEQGSIQIKIFLNGVLCFKSQLLDEIVFRELIEMKERQYGVPFNISIGGGTQGLHDAFYGDDFKMNGEASAYQRTHILPIEEHFCGSFNGIIRKFKIYDEELPFTKIMNNYLYEVKS